MAKLLGVEDVVIARVGYKSRSAPELLPTPQADKTKMPAIEI